MDDRSLAASPFIACESQQVSQRLRALYVFSYFPFHFGYTVAMCKQACVSHISFALRHSCASNLANLGRSGVKLASTELVFARPTREPFNPVA